MTWKNDSMANESARHQSKISNLQDDKLPRKGFLGEPVRLKNNNRRKLQYSKSGLLDLICPSTILATILKRRGEKKLGERENEALNIERSRNME